MKGGILENETVAVLSDEENQKRQMAMKGKSKKVRDQQVIVVDEQN